MSTVRTSDPFKKTPCYFIWIGPPSEIDEDELKIVGHDVDGVLKFAQCAENPITFYCLDKYVDYYKALFEKKRL